MCSTRPTPVVASSAVGSVSAWVTMTPVRSTPRCSFFQPRFPLPPCLAAAHSPSPKTDKPVLSTTRCSGSCTAKRSSARSRRRLRLESVVWSGAARPACIKPKIDRKKPSVWRNGRRKTSRSVSAVSIARSEYFLGPPGRPDGAGLHAAIASSESQSVTSPRWTSASSYAGQFPTRYLVLYFGCTLEFTRELCDNCGGRHKPRQDVHQRPYFPRSEAVPGGRIR